MRLISMTPADKNWRVKTGNEKLQEIKFVGVMDTGLIVPVYLRGGQLIAEPLASGDHFVHLPE